MQPAVSGLEKEFPGQVAAANVDATTPESRQEVQALGFRNHGLVVRDADGAPLWKQADHEVRIEDVRTALRELTSGGSPGGGEEGSEGAAAAGGETHG